MQKKLKTSDESSYGLRDVFRKQTKNLSGVASGVDYTTWDPEIDTQIPHNYSRKDLAGKITNKQELVESQGLIFDENIAVIGIILDLLQQDDLRLLSETIDQLMSMKTQCLLLSKGDRDAQKLFNSYIKKHPEKMALISNMDDQLIHKIVAGTDLFLFPCKFEPCNSLPLSCLKYGTIPIVYATGGLVDTIKDFSPETKKGYGFVFKEYSSKSLISRIKQAIKIFNDDMTWAKIIDRAMKLNFSWQAVAENYNKLYDKILS